MTLNRLRHYAEGVNF